MSLMHMLPDEMVGVSKPLVDSSTAANALILNCEDLKAPYKRLVLAHGALTAAMLLTKADRVEAIIEAQAKLDVRHDAIIRGSWGLFTAIAELIGGEEGALMLKFRDSLIPDGLSSQNKTYGGEAGQAELLALALTPEIRQRTDGFIVGDAKNGRTLTMFLDEWISLGRQLGSYEAERGQIDSEPSEGAELHAARLDWVRAMNAMITNAEMAGLDAKAMATLFGPLQIAERKGDERARDAKNRAAAEAKAAAAAKAAGDKTAAGEKPAADAKPGGDASAGTQVAGQGKG